MAGMLQGWWDAALKQSTGRGIGKELDVNGVGDVETVTRGAGWGAEKYEMMVENQLASCGVDEK